MIERTRERLRATGLLQLQLLAAGPIEPLGEGMDFRTYSAGAWVLRLPKSAESAARLGVEQAILQALPEHLPRNVRLPTFAHLVGATDAGELPFAVQAHLSGTPADQAGPRDSRALARALGELLTCLHTFPEERARALGVPHLPDAYSPRGRLLAVAEDVGRSAADALAATGVPPNGTVSCLIHADLEPEHILLDDAAPGVLGVLDWSDVAVSDPARDLAGLWAFYGDEVFDELVAHYSGPKDSGLMDRVFFLGRCHAVLAVHEARAGQISMTPEAAEALLRRVSARRS